MTTEKSIATLFEEFIADGKTPVAAPCDAPAEETCASETVTGPLDDAPLAQDGEWNYPGSQTSTVTIPMTEDVEPTYSLEEIQAMWKQAGERTTAAFSIPITDEMLAEEDETPAAPVDAPDPFPQYHTKSIAFAQLVELREIRKELRAVRRGMGVADTFVLDD